MLQLRPVMLFFFLYASLLNAENNFIRPQRCIYGGIGPSFVFLPEKWASTAYLQAGMDFPITNIKSTNFLMGPQAGYFFSEHMNLIYLGTTLKLSYQKELDSNHMLDIYGRMPIQLSLGKSHGAFAVGGNIGVGPGLAYYFSNKLGLYFEFGIQLPIHIILAPGNVMPAGFLAVISNLGITYSL